MIKRLFQNDFFVALLFLIAYLLTNSYIFGWDDQHLEIPLLQRFIDPTLYPGDYYVDGLAKNFSSYLYPILAHLIKLDQIQPVYLALFLISRFVMFYWIYRLWQFISGERFIAAMAVLMFFLMGRTEEFLYRTFSHQEFSYMFMFAGLYYFYRERFLVASLWLGLGANFHAIYNLFPFVFMTVFISLFRKDRFILLIKCLGVFLFFALPFLMWQIPHSLAREGAAPVPISEWLPIYLIACQQNFIFWTSTLQDALKDIGFVLRWLEPYLFLLGFYVFLCIADERVRRDKKLLSIVIAAYAFIIISFIFQYIIPSRFVIDLNLLRNEQFVRFMLMGYLTLWAGRIAATRNMWLALLAAVVFIILSFGTFNNFDLRLLKYKYVFAVFVVLLIFIKLKPNIVWLRKGFLVAPILAAFIGFSVFHYQFLQMKWYGTGMWQMYRNWKDMQLYVRDHTPKNALIMTPHDTEYGGFRIFSRRKVLVCYRDCGIVGFDYPAVVEWKKRIDDIEGFRMYVKEFPQQAVINGIFKYKVDYIVFMNYYQPTAENPLLKKIYQNQVLALYEVKHQ